MKILKISKRILQAILSITAFQTVFMAVNSLTPFFSLTVPNFVMFFQVIESEI